MAQRLTDAEVAEEAALRLVVADLVKHDPAAQEHMERTYTRAQYIVCVVRSLLTQP